MTRSHDFLLRFRIIISKNPASQDKISLDDKFWSGTVIDFPDENNNLCLKKTEIVVFPLLGIEKVDNIKYDFYNKT